MAQYTILTTRTQEAGLVWSHDHYAREGETKEQYLQRLINEAVTDPMYVGYQRAQTASFDASFKTVPELQQPAARAEIETVITSHGGTVVPAGRDPGFLPPAPPPLPPAPAPQGESS